MHVTRSTMFVYLYIYISVRVREIMYRKDAIGFVCIQTNRAKVANTRVHTEDGPSHA